MSWGSIEIPCPGGDAAWLCCLVADFQVVVFLKVTREAGECVGDTLTSREMGTCCLSTQKHGVIVDKLFSLGFSFFICKT